MPNLPKFALHIGLSAISYAKVERIGNDWSLHSSGELPWTSQSSNAEATRAELLALLQRIAKQEGLGREPIHVSFHNRMCVTRVVTGNREQVSAQLAEITDNSQHYLQLGLGDKLIGHSTVPIDDSRQHGQVAIIKRGLIETIETAAAQAGLELISVDGALTSVCRLVGQAGLDRSPLLLVWLGSSGAEIGISYKGRLQLNYHAGECVTAEQTARTIGKHMKRLRRFCDRYRQVDGGSELRQVMVLTKPDGSDELRTMLEQHGFDHVLTAQDLNATGLNEKLKGKVLQSAGTVSALGGLLVHLESDVLPTTDVFNKYLATKPQSFSHMVLRDGWHVLAAAALLVGVLCANWCAEWWVNSNEAELALVASNYDLERQQLLELDNHRKVLSEYQRLDKKISGPSIQTLVTRVANCLPEDCRLDWCGFDAQGELVLKGTMLQGDRTYEVLKALRDLPEISEVALESVGSTSNHGKTATLFEIHCEIVEQAAQSNSELIASFGNPPLSHLSESHYHDDSR